MAVCAPKGYLITSKLEFYYSFVLLYVVNNQIGSHISFALMLLFWKYKYMIVYIAQY